MIALHLTRRELSYLLGSVGGMLLMPRLQHEHREPLAALRDRLAAHVPLDAELRAALGLATTEQVG